MNKKIKSKFNYQESLERLDEILSDIQSGTLALDDYEATLKEAHTIIEASRKYLRNLEGAVNAFENGQ